MRQPIQVLIYITRDNSTGRYEYLMLHRSPDRGGWWQGISGGVEEGEKLIETAHREVKEETGLVPFKLEQTDISYSISLEDKYRYLYAPGVKTINEYVFLGKVNGFQEPTLSEEHVEYRWCSVDEACLLMNWESNIEALRKCHEMLLARMKINTRFN